MNLVIDIGNTRSKAFVFENSTLKFDTTLDSIQRDGFEQLFVAFPNIKKTIISSVADKAERIKECLPKQDQEIITLGRGTPLPIRNCYKSPDTLGLDRLAAAVGAWHERPKQNALIIDMGTAITFDVLTAEGEYIGGNISPGAHTRFRALNHFTKNLPLVGLKETDIELGEDTESAIRAGVQMGIEHEVNGCIERTRLNYKSLTVFITGGEGFFFAKKFKSSIFAPNLLAKGLNEILKFNT